MERVYNNNFYLCNADKATG